MNPSQFIDAGGVLWDHDPGVPGMKPAVPVRVRLIKARGEQAMTPEEYWHQRALAAEKLYKQRDKYERKRHEHE
jgi:hypothetical protein